jgi:hypothetical protein
MNTEDFEVVSQRLERTIPMQELVNKDADHFLIVHFEELEPYLL